MENIEANLAELAVAAPWTEEEEIREANPRKHYGREERLLRIPKPEPKPDPLINFQMRAAAFERQRAIDPLLINMDGLGFTGVNPPDTSGDVGASHFIQAINASDGTRYSIYDKTSGSVVAGPFRLSDLAGAGASGMGDPIVLYDHLANRWVLSEFTNSPANGMHVYVSKTSDPVTGGFHHYLFKTPNFPDYPKYGMSLDAYYVTSNESDGPAVYALDRAKMLQGQPATMQRFLAAQLNGFGFQALTPCDLDGPAGPAGAPGYVLRHHDDEVHNVGANDISQDFLDLYELRINWQSPGSSTFTGPIAIPIAEMDSDLAGLQSFSCFPQQGSTIRLDPLREVIMFRVQYRNFGTHESMVGSFVTDVDGNDHGGVRWFELRRVPGSTWMVHQEGTYAPDSHNRWMSSVAMDGSGNIAMVYNVSSSTMFPSLRFVGRRPSDPMGTMPDGEHTLVDGAAANASFRYGDYAVLCLDPADDHVFWMSGEYNPATKWSTRIGAFRFNAETPPPTPEVTPPTPELAEAGTDVERRLSALEEKVNQILERLPQR